MKKGALRKSVAWGLCGLGGFLAVGGLGHPARGVEYTWTGGSGSWNNPIKWSPVGGPPDQGDSAVIFGSLQLQALVSLSANVMGSQSPDHLFLGGHARLDTNGFRLNVDGPLYTSGNGTLDVRPVTGNPALIGLDAETIGVDSGSRIRNFNGSLRAADFNLNTGTLWLDGGGRVQATNYAFIGDGSGSKDAKLNVFNNGAGYLAGNVTFQADADVDIAGRSSLTIENSASFYGGEYTGSGLLRFDGANTNFNGNTTIDMTSGRVDLDGDEGPLAAGQSINVNANLVLNVNAIDAGNNTFGTRRLVGEDRIVISNFGKLTVNLTDANAAWTMAGHLMINGPQGQLQAGNLAGSDLLLTGKASIKGNSGWSARTDISGQIQIDADSSLALYGGTIGIPNQLLGGVISGAGTLHNNTGHALMGHGIIDTDINFLSNSELRASNGKLVLGPQADIHAVSIIGTRNQDGILEVQKAWNTVVAAEALELKGGQVIGESIVNGGTTRGHGRIGVASFDNQGKLIPQGGELIVETTGSLDLDGSNLFSTGWVDATQGNLRVKSALGDDFNSTITVGSGRHVIFEQGWTLGTGLLPFMKGNLYLQGGANSSERAMVGGGPQVIQGSVHVEGEAAFEAPTTFAPTAQVLLPGENARLRMFADSTIQTGATFTGQGRLVNTSGSTMTLGGSLVGVTLENAGVLEIKSSVEDALVNDLDTTALSRIRISIDGTELDQYDRLNVARRADLQGNLTVEVNQAGGAYADPALPGELDQFTILDGITVVGKFDSFRYAGQLLTPMANYEDRYYVGDGLFRKLRYDRSSVVLTNYRALLGDANGDGLFDSTDLVDVFQVGEYEDTIVQNSDWTEGDWNGDGDFDSQDFVAAFQTGAYESGFILTPRERVAAVAAVPEPGTMGLVGILMSLGLLRSTRRS